MVKRKPVIGNKIFIDLHYNPTVYNKFCVIIKEKCHTFTWISKSKATKVNKRKLADTSDMKKYEHIFSAISAHFPPIFDTQFEYLILYKTFSNISLIEKKNFDQTNENGLLIQTNYDTVSRINKNNVFKCHSGTLISFIYVCDDKVDCPGDIPSDEINCTCTSNKSYSNKCKLIINKSGIATCSLFYVTVNDHSCQPTWKMDITFHIPQNSKRDITCSNENYIDPNFENDSISAYLGIEYWEDPTCTRKGQIPCIKGYKTCFAISDICVYKLDFCGALVPCRTGEHMQNCKYNECNMKVKCPGFYCIPWQYICDGKWDCPNGYDESHREKCIQIKHCIDMLKCISSQTCIHISSICDGIVDCPNGDDEHLCSLSKGCPSFCDCLHLTIVCLNIQNFDIQTAIEFPYQIIYITLSAPSFIYNFLSQLQTAKVLSLKNDQLRSICNHLPSINGTVMIDLSSNIIAQVTKKCFLNGYSVKVIKMNNNQLSTFCKATILHLYNLILLDLSNNSLRTLFHDLHDTHISFKILIVFNNQINIMTKSSLKTVGIQLLLTDDYHLCCSASSKTICTAHTPWYTVCSFVLINGNLRVCYYLVSFVIIITSILSLVAQKLSTKNDVKRSFSIIMYSISFVDFLFGVYLVILWLGDLKYSDSLIIESSNWKSSGYCLVAYFITLNFNIISPALLSILSFARLMIIINPLKTSFKHKYFVLKMILCIVSLAFFISSLVFLSVLSDKVKVPFRLCSPLVYTPGSSSFFRVITLGLISFQMSACILIVLMYTKLWKTLKMKDEEIGNILKQKQKSIAPYVQICILMFSNVLCWILGNMIYSVSVFMDQYPIHMMMWTTVLVSPINSVIHPIVFILIVSKKS